MAKIDVALVSKVHPMRSHSVAAEGGTAAVLRPEEGDTYELHAWDTVKGSDFLADQDAVDMFVRVLPEEIFRVEHWGVPWNRDCQRPNRSKTLWRPQFSPGRLRSRQDRFLPDANNAQHAPEVRQYHALRRILRDIDRSGEWKIHRDHCTRDDIWKSPRDFGEGVHCCDGRRGQTIQVHFVFAHFHGGWICIGVSCGCSIERYGIHSVPPDRSDAVRES